MEGGTGGDSASETQPTDYPYYLEGGTPNVLGIAGLAAGLKYVMERGLAAIEQHELELTERLAQQLQAIPSYELFGVNPGSARVGTLSFRHRDLAAVEVGGILDQSFSIAVRPGLHCASLYPPCHRHLPRWNRACQPRPLFHDRRHRCSGRASKKLPEDHDSTTNAPSNEREIKSTFVVELGERLRVGVASSPTAS